MTERQKHTFFAGLEIRIKQLAKEKGMPLAELAKAIGMTEAGFHKMLGSESIKVKTLFKVADVLHQPVTLFFQSITTKYLNESQLEAFAEPEEIYNRETEGLKKQIALLESQIEDKNKIIELLSTKKKS